MDDLLSWREISLSFQSGSLHHNLSIPQRCSLVLLRSMVQWICAGHQGHYCEIQGGPTFSTLQMHALNLLRTGEYFLLFSYYKNI